MDKKIKKLQKPPAAQNFVRYIDRDANITAKNLVRFANSFPRYSYQAGQKIIADRLVLGLDSETAMKAVNTKGAELSRPINKEYVRAFLDYDEIHCISSNPSFEQFVAPYRVSNDVHVPVKPTAVCLDNGNLSVLFTFGWATVPFNKFQWRLLMTMIEDSIFTLTDFRTAEGKVLCFPRDGKAKESSRRPMIINRGDYNLFSKSEMRKIMDDYLHALEIAKTILSKAGPQESSQSQPSEGERPNNINQLQLF